MFRLTKHRENLLVLCLLIFGPSTTAELSWALDLGEKAPEFTLPATTGEKISLSQFRAKKIVLLEFYGADYSPV
jgi:hypothetical protein